MRATAASRTQALGALQLAARTSGLDARIRAVTAGRRSLRRSFARQGQREALMHKILARVAPHPQTIIVLGAAYLGVLSGASMPHMQWWLDPTGCVPCTLLTKCLCTPPCPRAVVGCAHSFDSWPPTGEWYVAAVTGALGPTRSGPHTCMCMATNILVCVAVCALLAPRFCSTSTRQGRYSTEPPPPPPPLSPSCWQTFE